MVKEVSTNVGAAHDLLTIFDLNGKRVMRVILLQMRRELLR